MRQGRGGHLGDHVLPRKGFEKGGFASPVGAYEQAPLPGMELYAHVLDDGR